MKSLKTAAVIIKRTNINEADRLVTIFSEHAGKLTVKAKAVRKPLSKLAGGLELLYLSDFHLVLGNSIYTVTEVVPRKVYQNIHRDLQRLEAAFFIAEVVNKLTEEGVKNLPIFNLINASLDLIEHTNVSSRLRRVFAGWFLLNFLAVEGVTPELKHCQFCHRMIDKPPVSWSHSHGGLLHEEHAGIDPAAKLIDQNTVKLVRLLLGGKPELVLTLKVAGRIADQLFEVIYDFFRWQTKIELKTVKSL